jgi:alkyl hydroperoxide reductase subunit F
MYDVLIVGGGPAGLSAAVYAARKRLKTLLVSIDIGGQINTTRGIENYLGYQFIEGPELIDKFTAQIDKYPIEQKIGPRITLLEKSGDGFQAITDEGVKYLSKAIVFAAGKKPKKLNVPGEAELTGRGVSYCAICDGPWWQLCAGGSSGFSEDCRACGYGISNPFNRRPDSYCPT